MKSIDKVKRDEVIRLFFYGYLYDDILKRLDIGKGSVVNIIEEFRDGMLPVPPGLMTYIDELRHVAVDLKKLNTNPKKMKECLKLYSKIVEMHIDAQDVEQWMDMCRSIAKPSVTGEQFVEAALKLTRLTKEKGHTYDEVLRDYDLKQKQLNDIKDEIEVKRVMLQLNEEKLKELRLVIKEYVKRAAHHSRHQINPIIVHLKSPDAGYHSSCTYKHNALAVPYCRNQHQFKVIYH